MHKVTKKKAQFTEMSQDKILFPIKMSENNNSLENQSETKNKQTKQTKVKWKSLKG